MKKCLIGLLLLLSASVGYADTVTVDSLVSADDVTIGWLNGFKNTVIDFLNSIDGENIQVNTITETVFDDNTNIVTFRDEAFNDFVFTGLLPPTSATLASTTTAGTAYIVGARVAKDATAKTYTASKDTYVDLSNTGTYTYAEVANGGATPSVTTNSIRLAKVVTNSTAVTSVADMRVTGVQLSTNEDFYIKGMEIITTSGDANVVTADAGICYIGATRISKTSQTGLNVGTAASYINGVSERGTSKWIYIYINSSGSVNLDDTAPDYHDTSGNTVGIKYYFKNGTDYWRCLGATRLNSTGSGSIVPAYQQGKKLHYDDILSNVDLLILNAVTQTTWQTNGVDATPAVPPIAQVCSFQLVSNGASDIFLRAAGSSAVNGFRVGGAAGYWPVPDVYLGTTQKCDYKGNFGTNLSLYVKDYTINIRE